MGADQVVMWMRKTTDVSENKLEIGDFIFRRFCGFSFRFQDFKEFH